MINLNSMGDHILSLVIVDSDVGSKILSEAKNIGVRGGTIFLGRGTIRNPILKALGLDEARKEIVLMITSLDLEEKIHEHLTKEFHMDKPNHGIILTLLVKDVFGLREGSADKNIETGGNNMSHEVIFTVVERGLGQDVVDAAVLAGSTGATIINARGSGIHESNKFFSINIEPEKEIVMIIIDNQKTDNIVKSIEETLHIDEPGKGILFVMGVNKVSGLFDGNKQK